MLAAFIPGFGLTAAYIVYIIALAMWKPHLAPKLPTEERTAPIGAVLYELLISFMPLTMLTVVVLGVIFFGLATPTESAAIGAVGALMLAIGYGADYSKRCTLLLLQGYVGLARADRWLSRCPLLRTCRRRWHPRRLRVLTIVFLAI